MKYLILLLPCLGLWNCSSDSGNSLRYPLAYRTSVSGNAATLHVDHASFAADSSGRITVVLTVTNKAGSPVSLTAPEWELESPEGLRSSPITDASVSIPGQATNSLTLMFEPINSLPLYRATGLLGDLKQSYVLRHSPSGLTVSATLSEAQYAFYKQQGATESDIRILVVTLPTDFETTELAHLDKHIPLDDHHGERTQHGVQHTAEEILVNGLNIRLSSYQHRDSVYVRAMLINHSPFVVTLDPSQFSLVASGGTTSPLVKLCATCSEIPKSQRGQFLLAFYRPQADSTDVPLNVGSLSFRIPEAVPVLYQHTITLSPALLIQ